MEQYMIGISSFYYFYMFQFLLIETYKKDESPSKEWGKARINCIAV